MSQPILPLIPSGATQVGELLSIVCENEYTKYYMHRFSTKRHDEIIRKLLRMLNETETLYSGTNMELRYSLIGENDAFSQ